MRTFDEKPGIGRREATAGLIASVLALPLTFRAKAASARDFQPLWSSARVLIGNSPADQSPSPFIECPLFLDNGAFADAFHTLDLSNLSTTGEVRGTVRHHNDAIEPNFGASIAADVAQGSDGIPYLLVGGEGAVTNGAGYFQGVDRAVVRCKYKVAFGAYGALLLVACVDCVVILVRD